MWSNKIPLNFIIPTAINNCFKRILQKLYIKQLTYKQYSKSICNRGPFDSLWAIDKKKDKLK